MKILVFSDSHGKSANMLKAISLHPDADMLFHLGDGTNDLNLVFESHPNLTVKHVNGNLEDALYGNKIGLPLLIEQVGGKKIYLCHGHRYNVPYTYQSLIYSAVEADADIVLYGHTHVKENKYIPEAYRNSDTPKCGLYVFNPGSISRPRDDLYPSYGIIEIRDNGILLSHGTIK